MATKLNDEKTRRFVDSYESFYSLIFSVVYSKVGTFQDAEDICQEVFVRFYNKLNEVENPRKWLFGCMKNVVFDHYKSKKGKDEDIEGLFDEISLGYLNGFSDMRILLNETMEEIYEEFGDRDAVLFDLVSVYNYSIAEAARHLGLSYKKARYRYQTMSEKILARLREKGIERIEDLL